MLLFCNNDAEISVIMEESLRRKTVKGVGWSAVDNYSYAILTFIVTLVLARLLTPGDYGLLGMTAIITSVCNTIVNAGLLSALIRKRNISEDDYNTAYFVNMFLSIIIYLIIFFIAPLIASFFYRDELTLLIRVLAVTLIISAFSIVQQARIHRRIDFKSQTKATLTSTISGGFVGITLALMGYGVWALVAQIIVKTMVNTFYLVLVNKWMPKLLFSHQSFKELFGFGWKMMVSSILSTIWDELNQLVVGKFYSPANLGQFTRAKQFSSMFSNNLTSIIQRVIYPVMSGIQEDKERMLAAYRKVIKTTMFITVIVMFSLGAVSEPLLYCLIGPKWGEAATYLPLLCVTGSFYPLHAINLNMLQVQGRSDLFLYLEIIRKVILVAPLFVGIYIGILPMLYTSIITSIMCYFVNSYYSGKMVGYSTWMQIKDVALFYLIAIIVFVSIYFLKFLPISNWCVLFIQLLAGFIVVISLCSILNLEEYFFIKNGIGSALRKMRHCEHTKI